MKTKILMTGGHAGTTAIAVIEEIKKREKDWEVIWVGASKATEGKSASTIEAMYFPKLGVKFHTLFTGRIQNKFTPWTVISLLKIPFGFIHATLLLLQVRPKVIFSFGGFASFPVVVIGYLLGIPILIHEQTAAVGRANMWSSFFAKKVLISRESSYKYFPKAKTILTGNPIRRQFIDFRQPKKESEEITILVMGGSRGSQTINSAVGKILTSILAEKNLIHITGVIDFVKYQNLRLSLDPKLSKRYSIYKTIDPSEMYKFYKDSDIVVSRAGANTVSEIIAIRKPSLLIPIPWSYMDEQTKNAQTAVDLGLARILFEDSLTSSELKRQINSLIDDLPDIIKNTNSVISPDIHASISVVDVLEEIVGE